MGFFLIVTLVTESLTRVPLIDSICVLNHLVIIDAGDNLDVK